MGPGILASPPMSKGTSIFKPPCIPEQVWGSEEVSLVLEDRDWGLQQFGCMQQCFDVTATVT